MSNFNIGTCLFFVGFAGVFGLPVFTDCTDTTVIIWFISIGVFTLGVVKMSYADNAHWFDKVREWVKEK